MRKLSVKWENFIHPGTQETGTEYLERQQENIMLNPALQKQYPKLFLLEPLYGPVIA